MLDRRKCCNEMNKKHTKTRIDSIQKKKSAVYEIMHWFTIDFRTGSVLHIISFTSPRAGFKFRGVLMYGDDME